jgi:hypothetical protein
MTRSRDEVVRQARDALDAITAANGGVEPPTLYAAHDIAPEPFALLIEALVQLGAEVDDELQRLAGIRDIGELL